MRPSFAAAAITAFSLSSKMTGEDTNPCPPALYVPFTFNDFGSSATRSEMNAPVLRRRCDHGFFLEFEDHRRGHEPLSAGVVRAFHFQRLRFERHQIGNECPRPSPPLRSRLFP